MPERKYLKFQKGQTIKIIPMPDLWVFKKKFEYADGYEDFLERIRERMG